MNQLVPQPTTAMRSPDAGSTARSAVSPIARSHASGCEASSTSMCTPACASYSCVSVIQAVSLSGWWPRKSRWWLLDGAGGQATDKVLLDKGEEDDDGNDRDDRGCEQLVPVLFVAGDVGGDADGERFLCVIQHEGKSDDVLVPGGDEGEDHGSHDAGHRERQHDPGEGPEAAATVEVGGFLDHHRGPGCCPCRVLHRPVPLR